MTVKIYLPPETIWSPPDGRAVRICSVCMGALPRVPVMLFKEDDSAAYLCDECLQEALRDDGKEI